MPKSIDKLTAAAKSRTAGIAKPDSGKLSAVARSMNAHFKGNPDYAAACREVTADDGRSAGHMTGPTVAVLLNVDWQKAQPAPAKF